ncbi:MULTISPECIES: type II toxin-antitoxin system VapC family toxin [Halomonadaceae]|uniref:Type II toxin-antitoxin system VapC family toxin n=1 Tax=Modicisalibacter zincidurans TaxID=1178777 RepID=A0ABP9RKT0_9GAMM|nr:MULTISPECIES: type II toxin-antitoxin system VapC family toxin [Halomonas]MCD6009669.1 type II toxin-antitoxin system VapC family toxin [Halomonas sp. IOP_31]|tara:strand:- start:14 stop:400 length:387 start_codon:yes stop_codon:yes gene_type:complete
MNLILDTHILLWAAAEPDRLSSEAIRLINDEDNELYFSAASLWEIVIKTGLQRPDFQVNPHLLRRGLIENGYRELPITYQHTLAVSHLPDIHKDPFDRILVAQAESEGFLLLTADELIARYPGPIRRV